MCWCKISQPFPFLWKNLNIFFTISCCTCSSSALTNIHIVTYCMLLSVLKCVIVIYFMSERKKKSIVLPLKPVKILYFKFGKTAVYNYIWSQSTSSNGIRHHHTWPYYLISYTDLHVNIILVSKQTNKKQIDRQINTKTKHTTKSEKLELSLPEQAF